MRVTKPMSGPWPRQHAGLASFRATSSRPRFSPGKELGICLFTCRLVAHIARYDGNSVLLVCADVSTKRHLVAAK